MEGLLEKNTQCGNGKTEIIVKVEKKEEDKEEVLNTEKLSSEKNEKKIENQSDNLKDSTESSEDTNDESSKSESEEKVDECSKSESEEKTDKLTDSEGILTSSSSNNTNSSGTANVVKTGNSSLSNLLVYTSESSSDSDSSSESESYESPDISDNEQEQESDGAKTESKKKNVQDAVRTFGELTLDDLPPVPDVTNLDVDVAEHDCTYIGTISAVIDRLVTVESLPNTPAYNLETLLFLDNGKKPLGYVYDVMGQVNNPIYVIRFNSKEEMDNIGVKKGLPVYSAPKTPHTQYVFLKQLMEVKGSDASWMGDNEVPPEHVDYSDDEEERRGRRTGKKTALDMRKRNSLERHKDFEKDMNVKNIIDTRLHKIRDSFEPSTKRLASNNNDKRGFPFQPSAGPVFSFGQPGMNPNVPSFNPFLSAPFMPNGMQMPPFGALPYMPHSIPPMPRMPPVQNVPPFMPSIPPPHLPQTMTSQAMPAPPIQTMHTISVPPAIDIGQQKHPQQVPPRMLYPTEMGLPRPLRNAFVPMYNPRVPNLWTYQSRPQNIRPTQNFCQPRPRGTYYPKKP